LKENCTAESTDTREEHETNASKADDKVVGWRKKTLRHNGPIVLVVVDGYMVLRKERWATWQAQPWRLLALPTQSLDLTE
jgi:hypothetical protein